MVIRTREEALRALSRLLDLDRSQQIVQMTVALAECLTPEARRILYRAHEGLLSGHLETRVRKRPAPAAKAPDVELEPLPPDAGPVDDAQMVAQLQSALDALKAAAVAIDVFSDMRDQVGRWELARIALQGATDFRSLVSQGASGAPDASGKMLTMVRRGRPWWHSEVPTVAAACERVWRESPPSKWRVGAHTLLDIVATTELRALYATGSNIPNVQAMNEPLAKIAATVTRLVRKEYPQGLPAESAFLE